MVVKHIPSMPEIAFTRPLVGSHSLAAERASWRMHLALRGREFASDTDLQQFVRAMSGPQPGPLPENADPKDRAQDLFYKARDTISPFVALKLLRAASRLDPDNVDVRVVLAQEESDPTKRLARLQEALALGRVALIPYDEKGPGDGNLWAWLPARPALRAHAAITLELIESGRLEEAVASCEELLALNPGDNQGARYVHFALLLELGRFEAARRVFVEHDEPETALFAWGRVLLELETGGDAEDALDLAYALTDEVEALLLYPALIDGTADYAAPGSTEEAHGAADLLWRAWHKHPAALDWLREQTTDDELREVPVQPVWEQCLEDDVDGLRPGVLPSLDPTDEATVERLWELVREGPDEDQPHIAEGAIEILEHFGLAGTGVETLIDYLARHTQEEALGDSAAERVLAGLGEAAVPSLLRAHAATDQSEMRDVCAGALARAGVRDEAILGVLLGHLEDDPAVGAYYLARYGDPAALPHLSAALDAAEPAPREAGFGQAVDLIDAIQELGGSFTPSQEERFADAIAANAQWKSPEGRAALEDSYYEFLESQMALPEDDEPSGPPALPFSADDDFAQRIVEPLAQAHARPGRNEPCWCGSGKKYKRCHLHEDEAGAD